MARVYGIATFFADASYIVLIASPPKPWNPDMPQARLWTEEDFQELLKNASKPYISGITLLGGDPFHPVNRGRF